MSMLGFFRKRQKLIFVIMVVLMVAFLVGMQGFEMLFGGGGGDATLAETRYGSLEYSHVNQADSDLELLRSFIGGFGGNLGSAALESIYSQADSQSDAAIAYALLVKEAQAADIKFTDTDVDDMIVDMDRSPGFSYAAMVEHLRANRDIPEDRVRETLQRWGLVLRHYQASTLTTPPSEAQLKHLYRDISEQIKLRVVKVDPEAFLDEVGEPTEEQLEELFETYKGKLAGEFQGTENFSYGYLEPARVSLAWLFVSRKAVERGSVPPAEDIQNWIKDHKDELTKEVSAEPEASDEEDDKDETDVVEPKVMTTVLMTPAEQREAAIQALKPQLIGEHFDEVLTLARREILGWEAPEDAKPPKPGQAYLDAAESLQLPGEDLLSREILLLAFEEPTELTDVVDAIARQADPALRAIAFPYGDHGEINIDPTVKIKSFARKQISVGEALAFVGGEIEDLPELSWGLCQGFDDVLFPVDGVRFFPVRAGVTDLLSRKELNTMPMLANARTQGQSTPVPLLQMAFNVKALQPNGQLEVGEDVPQAMLTRTSDDMGALIWRVLQARPASVRETITPDLRPLLISDWKLREAFKLAKAKAQEITTAEQLDAWIEEKGVEPVETQMLSRKRLGGPLGSPYPVRVWAMSFSDSAVDTWFLQQAFTAVAPTKVTDGSYDKVSQEIATIALPSEGYVTLVQRIDYSPAMKDGFMLMKQDLMQRLEIGAGITALYQWFRPSDIRLRADYKEAQPDDQ